MKPRSIIFLIVAAVLIVAGIIVCAVGSAGAKSDGIDIRMALCWKVPAP